MSAKIGEEGLDLEKYRKWENRFIEGKLTPGEIKEIETHYSERVMKTLPRIVERLGKTEIDDEVILTFYLKDHNATMGRITALSETMRKFINADVSHDCMARVCKITEVDSKHNSVFVETADDMNTEGKRYTSILEKKPLVGEIGVIHHGYFIRVPESLLNKVDCMPNFSVKLKKIKGTG